MDDSRLDGPATPGTLPATVPTRARRDGWTPERQQAFIAALAESGCVGEACKAVGVSRVSAYRLRARPEASIFRQAWDVALDYAIRNLSDAALSRALNGTPRPVFYKGEQVGEWRHYDERLTISTGELSPGQFRFVRGTNRPVQLLRYRDPTRYGAWLDGYEARRHPDGAGITLAHALNRVLDAAYDAEPFDYEEADAPLAEGPAKPAPAHAYTYKGPPEAEALFRQIAAACEGDRKAEAAADPTDEDRRSGAVVRRPRRVKRG